MFDWSPAQFLLFAVLIAPGFVARSVYRLLVPAPRQDATSLVLELATYGMINLGLVAWMIPLVMNRRLVDERPLIFGLGTTAMFVIVPMLLGVLTFVVRKSRWATRWFQHPMPTAWDYLFSQRRALWVLCHLKNGQRVGGFFGRESYASSYPVDAEIYVENIWRVDENGRFAENIVGNAGMIIRYADCQQMEFYRAEAGS
jgi:hypothetical protein